MPGMFREARDADFLSFPGPPLWQVLQLFQLFGRILPLERQQYTFLTCQMSAHLNYFGNGRQRPCNYGIKLVIGRIVF